MKNQGRTQNIIFQTYNLLKRSNEIHKLVKYSICNIKAQTMKNNPGKLALKKLATANIDCSVFI